MKRAWIKKTFPRFLVFLSTALISAWIFQTQTHPAEPIPLIAVPETVPIEEPEVFLDYTGEDDLFLHGYEVHKVFAKVAYKQLDEHGHVITHPVYSAYVAIKKDGNTVAKFDGINGPVGNVLEYGLFDLLGDESEQLIISQTISRGGRHWVVTFDPEFRVLFDSADYNVGREDFSIVDVDEDGVHEISLPIVSFYGMEGLQSVGETPLPEIIFKYDAQQMKYLPANHLFVDYALRHLNPETEKEIYQHHRFDLLLDYVYAGKEREGWASFDQHYSSPDKEVMRSRIKAILKDDPVYKYIYKNSER